MTDKDAKMKPELAFDIIRLLWPSVTQIKRHETDDMVAFNERGRDRILGLGRDVDWNQLYQWPKPKAETEEKLEIANQTNEYILQQFRKLLGDRVTSGSWEDIYENVKLLVRGAGR